MVGQASPKSLPIRLLTSQHDPIISNRCRSPQANFNTDCDGTSIARGVRTEQLEGAAGARNRLSVGGDDGIDEAKCSADPEDSRRNLQPLANFCAGQVICRKADRYESCNLFCMFGLAQCDGRHGQPHRVVSERRNDAAMQEAATIAVTFGYPEPQFRAPFLLSDKNRLPRIGHSALSCMRLKPLGNVHDTNPSTGIVNR